MPQYIDKETLVTMEGQKFATCLRCGGILEYYDAMFDWYRCLDCRKITARKDLKRKNEDMKAKKTVDFFSIHSREEVAEIDKRIEKKQKEYEAKLRDKMMKAKDFPMTD